MIATSYSSAILKVLPASVGGSPVAAGDDCGSPQGQGHWQQKFWEILLSVSPPEVRN